MVNFALTFSHFRYHGNWGWSDVNFNDTSKLLHLENPLFGATSVALSCIGQVLANFELKFPNFRCHGNRGRSDVNFNDTSKLLDLENPLFGATYMALCHILAELWLILC